ncbi:uncharacterized protein LOC123315641 [Coccinella septempunctata]|uniref:uncharacterized protein LOC123315641 n=1 Tax=Coccinella septempunctata TaxID=41139 RepID=UPI001D093E7B|nr:uncharacterized protein LOC123315641 [Coccinella septempunctata]
MLVLDRNMQIDFILIINLVPFIWYLPISHSQDLEEKNWLDACDIQRMKKGGFEVEPAKPTTPKPPSRPSRPPVIPIGAEGVVTFRPLAPKDDLLNAIKQKFVLDVLERGGSLEKGDWTKDARGFMSDFYGDDDDDYDYYSSGE